MCWNGKISVGLTVVLFSLALWVYIKTRKFRLFTAIALFCSIELIHSLQYEFSASELPSQFTCTNKGYHIDNQNSSCDTYINKVATLLSYLHFCFQPFLVHMINVELATSRKQKEQFRVIRRLCFVAGLLWFGRYFLSFSPFLNSRYNTTPSLERSDVGVSFEWFRGQQLCSYARVWTGVDESVALRELRLLGTSIPLADSSYLLPPLSLHGFLMYTPFVVFGEARVVFIRGVLLLLAGPAFSCLFTRSGFEQGNITALSCIAQLFIVVVALRRQLFSGSVEEEEQVVGEDKKEDNEGSGLEWSGCSDDDVGDEMTE